MVEGIAKIGTPLAALTEAGIVEIGRIAGMEVNHKVGGGAVGRRLARWLGGGWRGGGNEGSRSRGLARARKAQIRRRWSRRAAFRPGLASRPPFCRHLAGLAAVVPEARVRQNCATPCVCLQTVDKARQGESVAMKIEGGTTEEKSRMFGRHFDHTHQLVRGWLGGWAGGWVVGRVGRAMGAAEGGGRGRGRGRVSPHAMNASRNKASTRLQETSTKQ